MSELRETSRAHLEALALLHTLHDPLVAEWIDFARLSPAAAAWIAFAAEDNTTARARLGADDTDEFRMRLAKRTLALTIEDTLFYPRQTVLDLVNVLPQLGSVRHRRAA